MKLGYSSERSTCVIEIRISMLNDLRGGDGVMGPPPHRLEFT